MQDYKALEMDPLYKQALDDTFDAFTMLAGGSFVTLMHVAGGYTRYSPGAVELFGFPGEYIPNGAMDWVDYLHPEDRKRYLDVMGPLATGETMTYDITYRVRTKDGSYSMFRAVGAVMRDDSGAPDMIGGALINEGLVENTDPITVLRNQYAFFDEVPDQLRQGDRLCLLLIGIGNMESINEIHGYGVGNRVLQQAGWIIQETLGDRGTVYRMKGAKFAIVTGMLNDQETSALYDSIRMKLQRGIRLGETRHNLPASGGMIAVQGMQMDTGTIYACLYFAYKESKERKYGDLINYNGTLGSDTHELEMIGAVRSSVLDGCNGFHLRYQIVHDIETGKKLGVEALIRWHSDPYGEIFPLKFIPVLEQDFVFEELVAWTLRQSMTDGLKLLEKDPTLLVGVNISSAQVEDEYFIDSLDQIVKSTRFPAQNLCLELTKGCRLLDVDRLKRFTDALHSRGIGVVIDDFGSGFDSLNSLKELHADIVKLDRSLVQGLTSSDETRHALAHLTELASVYGPNVCVKGVDDEQMRSILRDYPVNSMQGYIYTEPQSIDELIAENF